MRCCRAARMAPAMAAFAPAEAASTSRGSPKVLPVPLERRLDRRHLARQSRIVEAGAAADPVRAGTAEQGGVDPAAAVVLPMPSSPTQRRSVPPAIASMPKAMVATQDFSSIAGSSTKSAVGMSRARSKTLKPSPRPAQIWLMAAPPPRNCRASAG